MAYTNFPSTRGIRILDTNEQVLLGSFSPDVNFELVYIRVLLYKHGTAGGSETLQCIVHHDQTTDLTEEHATSTAVTLASWSTDTRFIGWCRFDFNKEAFNAANTYNISLKTANYTQNLESYYLSCVYDSPGTTNTTQSDSPHHIVEHTRAFELYVKYYEY